MSESLPFLERPAMLDDSIAGDVGFDRFGFAKAEKDRLYFRQARPAGHVGRSWMAVSELLDSKSPRAPVDATDRAPSILKVYLTCFARVQRQGACCPSLLQ
jgi:hypothetical protein